MTADIATIAIAMTIGGVEEGTEATMTATM
jgi:hypothetical protein